MTTPPVLTKDEFDAALCALEALFAEPYGYTDWANVSETTQVLEYLLFRDRESSFHRNNAVVILRYRRDDAS